uniref:Uncharacterized protein n=1 Tax=Anguilla anguilla TaxID=7936 RepID=A0A0E9RFT5_ANGAN
MCPAVELVLECGLALAEPCGCRRSQLTAAGSLQIVGRENDS